MPEQPFVAGHGWTPPARTFGGPERCEVLLARHPCPYSRADHDPDLPPEDVDFTGRRRTITRDPQVPHLNPQPVPGCFRCDLRKDEMR